MIRDITKEIEKDSTDHPSSLVLHKNSIIMDTTSTKDNKELKFKSQRKVLQTG